MTIPGELLRWMLPPLLVVDVTAEHIMSGTPTWPCGCPVAYAVADALGISREEAVIEVDATTVTIYPPYPSGVYSTDPDGQRWIEALDDSHRPASGAPCAEHRHAADSAPCAEPITMILTLRED